MDNSNNTSDNIAAKKGIDFFDGLTLLFIGLRLTGYINWNWLLVLLPIYYQFVIQVILFIGLTLLDIIEFLVKLFKKIFLKNKEEN